MYKPTVDPYLPPVPSSSSIDGSPKALLDQIYCTPHQDRLEFARQLFQKFGSSLKSNFALTTGLDKLCRAARHVNNQMALMDIKRLCSACAADPAHGGCCSLYMAGETDAIQLLLNMLAGITVDQVRDDGVECCYLGTEGCILLFKPMFCLNYLCERIQKGCAPAQLVELEKRTGKLLQFQYQLEQEILRIIRSA